MAESLKDRLIEILINGKLISQEQLNAALDTQRKIGGSLGKILVWKGFISQKDLMLVMSRQLNIPPIDLSKYKVDKSVIGLIPEKLVKQYVIMPVSKIGNILTVISLNFKACRTVNC